MRTLIAALLAGLLGFGFGSKLGRSIEHSRAESAAEDVRYETEAAVANVIGQLERETAADPAILRQIVRAPFSRRGLLP